MIRIVEVGPRDGLQNEPAIIVTADKVALVDALSPTGISEIEVSAFVSPKWIPQLADAEEVFAQITRNPRVTYSALVPNERGLDRALAATVDKIAVFTAASESFNQHNINASIAESLGRFKPVIARTRSNNIPVRGYISTAFWCPYEGKIKPGQTIDVAQRLLDLGVDELSIGDTIGMAQPDEVRALLNQLLTIVEPSSVAMHFHDTYGRAAANVLASYELGISSYDSSVAGIGGCPYAPGASGNIATETLISTLRSAGAEVAVDGAALNAASSIVRKILPIERHPKAAP